MTEPRQPPAIQWAELIAGTERPIGIGRTGASRCALRVAGKAVSGIIKRIPLEHVVTESFAALLLRGWGLPVPDPYLVDVGGALAFGSADAGYPNLLQPLTVGLEEGSPERDAAIGIAIGVAVGLANAPLAAVADEAIDNRDRNLENILWDGQREAWIDHAHSLGQSQLADHNKLCFMSVMVGQEAPFRQAAVARTFVMARDLPDAVADAMATMHDTRQQAEFVASRMSDIASRILARFPAPDDLLSRA
ncbi:hypothetical protein CO641_02260 [Lysobacteraceae bacterium NML91-0213]|nr:hypothetical protein CO641_02260 [Xanthomonadaceae bacterium NML91-0213]